MVYEVLSGSLGTLPSTLGDRTVQPLFADEKNKAQKTLGS